VTNIISKSGMTLYSPTTCALSHSTRLVLHEKGISSEIIFYDQADPPEDLLELNPNSISPTLIDRYLVLYDSRIIMEYLDERFPHPPLHDLDPVSRAKVRMLIKRIDQDWYQLLDEILTSGEKKSARAKKMLRESLLASEPVFAANDYFLSNEFSLVDCVLAPLLWRLSSMGIDLLTQSDVIGRYANRLFNRDAFQLSLSDEEKQMLDS
jgi:RNA polymerase-associated protein